MTTPTEMAIAAYLRQSIVVGRDHERIGPFTASWSRTSANPFLNYAIPDDGGQPSAADLDAFMAAYRSRGLAPRLEYLPSLAPAVEPALVRAGFAVEGRLVLMLAGPERDVVVPDGIELTWPGTNDELRGVRRVQAEAYGDDEPVDDAAMERLRSNLDGGAGGILARQTSDREPVGAGEFTAPIDRVCEITSIAVRAAWRRRGIAAAVTARLLADARCAGVAIPFLMANEAESQVYARVGFRAIGEVLHISAPAGQPDPPVAGTSG